ncbi:SDR family oxidoreductase [soil metagenome]
MRHVAITGASGLVGSNLARHLLQTDPDVELTLLDLDPDSTELFAHLGPEVGRARYRTVDITDRGAELFPLDEGITHVVHAAALCHVPEWEVADPMAFIDANVVGTGNVVLAAARLPEVVRVVHVSSGGVYGDPTRWSTDDPQPEEGPFDPPEVYAISKLAGEQLARRLAELEGMDLRVVRLSAVWGPMERVTRGRLLLSLPHAIARAVRLDEPLVLTARTFEAGGDFLSATDVAAGIGALLAAPDLVSSAFNIAYGRWTTVPELLDAARRAAPGLRVEEAADGEAADIDMDPANRRARWNAYAIDRLTTETGWAPRPLAEQFAEHLAWSSAQV